MYGYLLMGILLVTVAIGLLVVLVAGDVRRRRVLNRRRWYQRRVHAAMDRVQALKLELEPPLEGAGQFISVEVPEKLPSPEESAAKA